MANVHDWFFRSNNPFTKDEIIPLVERLKKLTHVRGVWLIEDGSFLIDMYGMHEVKFPDDFMDISESHDGSVSVNMAIECCDSFSYDYDKNSKQWIEREPTWRELGMLSQQCDGCAGWDSNYRWYNSEVCDNCDIKKDYKKMKYEKIE